MAGIPEELSAKTSTARIAGEATDRAGANSTLARVLDLGPKVMDSQIQHAISPPAR